MKARAGWVELVVGPCSESEEPCTLAHRLPLSTPLILTATDNGGAGWRAGVAVTLRRSDADADVHSPAFPEPEDAYVRTLTEGATEFKPMLQVQVLIVVVPFKLMGRWVDG